MDIDGNELNIDSLNVSSEITEDRRKFKVSSDRASLEAEGQFELSRTVSDIQRLVKEYKLIFLNDQQKLGEFYANQPKRKTEKYGFDYKVSLDDINPLLGLFVKDVKVGRGTVAEGNFKSGYTSIFSLHSNIDTLLYKNHHFHQNEIDITTSKIADSTDVLASVFVSSENQFIEGMAEGENFYFESVWQDTHMYFQSNLEEKEGDNYAELIGELEFLENSTMVRFLPSNIQALGNVWGIEKSNNIVISGREVDFDNLRIYNQDQNISIAGSLSDSLQKKLRLEINNVQAENLNPFFNQNFKGVFNGFAEVSNAYKNPTLNSDIDITEFSNKRFSCRKY